MIRRFSDDRLASEQGSAAIETVIAVPVMMLMIGFIIFVGRMAVAQQEVITAAQNAARAGAMRQTSAGAQNDANAAMTRVFRDADIDCRPFTLDLNTSSLAPGGQVTATVTCVIGTDDIIGLGIGRTVTVTESATAVVDTYRGG